jgi:Mn2+/Fe2+ NRAMP family transporter
MHEWVNPKLYNFIAWVAVVVVAALAVVLLGITVRDLYFSA